MSENCLHAVTDYDMCPTRCQWATCYRDRHVLTTDPALLFEPDVDRSQALRQSCVYCEHFLLHGPRKQAPAVAVAADAAPAPADQTV
jgi:hypothetical protein